MNKKSIENIIFIVGMVLFIPPVLVYLYCKEANWYLLWIICSLIPLFFGVFLLKVIFAKNESISDLYHMAGVSNFYDWLNTNDSRFGKFVRFSMKVFWPILLGASVVIGIALKFIL